MTAATRGNYQPPRISVSFTRLAPIHDQPWREHAACQGKNVNNWYPEATGGGSGRAERQRSLEAGAKLVCQGCPVRAECLNHAIASGELFGIHGGLNTDERRALKRFVQTKETA